MIITSHPHFKRQNREARRQAKEAICIPDPVANLADGGISIITGFHDKHDHVPEYAMWMINTMLGGQRVPDEIIVIADAPTDRKLLKWLKKKAKIFSRVKVVETEKEIGVAKAYQMGFEESKGEMVCFFPICDFLDAQALKAMETEMNGKGPAISGTAVFASFVYQLPGEVFEKCKDKPGIGTDVILCSGPEVGPPLLWRSEVERVGGLDMRTNDTPAVELCERIGRENIVPVQQPLFFHRLRPDRDGDFLLLRKFAAMNIARDEGRGDELSHLWATGLIPVELEPLRTLRGEFPVPIVMAQERFCTRTVKLARAMAPSVAGLHGLTRGHTGMGAHALTVWEAFDTMNVIPSPIDTVLALEKYKPGIVHCPNWPDEVCKEFITVRDQDFHDLKVVWDVHDLGSIMFGQIDDDTLKTEAFCAEKADAIFTVSETLKQAIVEKYGRDDTEIYWACPAKAEVPDVVKPALSAGTPEAPLKVCYIGHIAQSGYRDIRPIFKALVAQPNVELHLHSLSAVEIKDYHEGWPSNFIYHNCLPSREMYKVIANYDVGLMCFSLEYMDSEMRAEALLHAALPNKFFDYLATGLPTMVVGGWKETSGLVETHGVGEGHRTVPTVDESLVERFRKYKATLLAKREMFTMESQIEKVLGTYRRLLG